MHESSRFGLGGVEQSAGTDGEREESAQEKKARLAQRYIENKIIAPNESVGADTEKEISEYYEKLSPRERAESLYNKVMAFRADQQEKETGETQEPAPADPMLISEIKVLVSDSAVRELFPKTYGEARLDAKKLRSSEVDHLWQSLETEIEQKSEDYEETERKVHLQTLAGKGDVSTAKSRMERLANNLTSLERRKSNLEHLVGHEKTAENTDLAAHFQYETLKKYKQEYDKGFTWLPHCERIHKKTIGVLLNGRWPVLIGEAGSGKSDQADAAAIELTGYPPTTIECSQKTGEKDLIKDIAIDSKTGGSYEQYGPLMQAMTGYEDSRQTEPSVKTGRIVRFDEAYLIPHDSSAYAIIKRARQVKPGDLFYGKPVLPGACAIWTTNPPGVRYPHRYSPDPAMRRELAEIGVDYPPMSNEKPELFEFALSTLMDSNFQINAAKRELAPAYETKEVTDAESRVLPDGRKIVAKDELVGNMTDRRHGALWRFCGAVKALQESFVYGNANVEKYPDSLLRFTRDADGNVAVTTDGTGEPLTINATITLGELATWMIGFNERRQKRDEDFRVDTLTEWLNFKINAYVDQSDEGDKKKIRAIFEHFNFLSSDIPQIENSLPLTPKEVGYLSPRVARPVHLGEPQVAGEVDVKQEVAKDAVEYKTRQVLLEDGYRVLIKEAPYTLGDFEVSIGGGFMRNEEDFVFVGVVEDAQSENNGVPVGRPEGGEQLYVVVNAVELKTGVLQHFRRSMKTEMTSLQKNVAEFEG